MVSHVSLLIRLTETWSRGQTGQDRTECRGFPAMRKEPDGLSAHPCGSGPFVCGYVPKLPEAPVSIYTSTAHWPTTKPRWPRVISVYMTIM